MEKIWKLVIHGGAGVIERASISPQKEAAIRAGLEAALNAGSDVLERGGHALDAVEAAVRQLEDIPTSTRAAARSLPTKRRSSWTRQSWTAATAPPEQSPGSRLPVIR